MGAAPTMGKMDSQQAYADRKQTAIIFDWDDTLFPTAYIRHDLELRMTLPLGDQGLSGEEEEEIADKLANCAANAAALLRVAQGLGQVVLVTLAKPPWVCDACRNFYPGIWDIITELGIKVVYAQDNPLVDRKATKGMSDEEVEIFWSRAKGMAISKELKRIYSSYAGQSWKNVISIGDSEFERLGTLQATEEYMREQGIINEEEEESAPAAGSARLTAEAVVKGHKFKVRTKTFKMVSQPTVDELTVEIDMCRQWLPLMVEFDAGFDIDLCCLENLDDVQAIESKLRENKEFEWTGRNDEEDEGAEEA